MLSCCHWPPRHGRIGRNGSSASTHDGSLGIVMMLLVPPWNFMNITITLKQFSLLARTFQEHLKQYGELPKGHYCHILEATARGLGFSSKSVADQMFQFTAEIHVPVALISDHAAQQWVKTTSSLNIPHGVFQISLQHCWPHFNFNENSNMQPFYKEFHPSPLSEQANSTSNIVSKYASVIWSTADVLRGVGVKASEWPNHMMPFFALMLVESRAICIRDKVLSTFGAFDPTDPNDVEDLKTAYMASSGNSHTYHEDLLLHQQNLQHVVDGGPAGFIHRLDDYLKGYDENTQRLLGITPREAPKSYLNIDGTVRFLTSKEGDALYHYCLKWAKVDLSQYDSSAITTLEEHIKRKWADISADTAGEHYTPADLIEFVSRLILSHLERHPLHGNILKIYDPTCGGGNMLYGVENVLRSADHNGSLRNATGERYSFKAYGQELNDQLFALCSIEGRHHDHADIREGNTLSQDRFAGEQFNVIVANPPYGTNWKQIQTDIENDTTGRFPVECRPSVSDGQHLFLQHIQHHLSNDGIAMVFCSGSTLFSGDAGGGESNARSQYILKNDGVWGLIQLPKNEFFNTGINTYVWVFWKGKPEKLKKKMFLLNAEGMFQRMRKSMGNKNSEMSPYDQERVKCLIESAELCFEEDRNDFALTIDLENRMVVSSTADWVNPNQIIKTSKENQEFDSKLAIQSQIHIKQIKHKDATLIEPVYLRGLDTDQVHYNKLGLELRRGGAQAFSGNPIDLKKCALHIALNSDLGDLWISSGSSMEDVRASLELARSNALINIAPISENDSKAVESALKLIAETTMMNVFVDSDNVIKTGVYQASEAQYAILNYYVSEDKTIVANDGTQLGVGVIKIKPAFIKTKGKTSSDGVWNVTATLGPKLEKDTETIVYHKDPIKNEEEIQKFLQQWVQDSYVRTGVTVGCEINFNQLFPKISERKTLAEVNQELAQLDEQINQFHKGGI